MTISNSKALTRRQFNPSIGRITGIEKKTITRVLLNAGEHCEQLMSRKIKNVEAGEIWGFVGCKNRHKLYKGITDPHVGDAYTWVGIERNTKLILAWHLGERGMVDCEAFSEKLHEATTGRFQLTTDKFRPYDPSNTLTEHYPHGEVVD